MGFRRRLHQSYYVCMFSNGKELKCSVDHPLITYNGTVTAKNLTKKMEIYTDDGGAYLTSKRLIRKDVWLYDAMHVKNHSYYTNGISSHNCEFLGSSNTLIAPSKLQVMPWRPPVHKINEIDVYELPADNHIYMMCVDTAEGQNLDYSAFTIIDVTDSPYRLVAKYRNNKISPMMFPSIIYNVATKYNNAHVLVETNNIGSQVAETLHTDLEYENLFSTSNMGRGGQKISSGFKKSSKLGVKTTTPIKSLGCSNLKSIIEGDKLIIQDEQVITELHSFVASGKSFSAETGHHDDLVMTLVLFGWLACQPVFKELTDVDIRMKMIEDKEKNTNEELLPFGIIATSLDHADAVEVYKDAEGTNWDVIGQWEENNKQWNDFSYVSGYDQDDGPIDW